jgi:histone H3/H4
MGLCVKAEVARAVKKAGLRASGGIYDALDKKIEELLMAAAERAKTSHRSTVMPQDI